MISASVRKGLRTSLSSVESEPILRVALYLSQVYLKGESFFYYQFFHIHRIFKSTRCLHLAAIVEAATIRIIRKKIFCPNFIKKTMAKVLPCEFCEIFKNSFFTQNLRMNAFALLVVEILTHNSIQ